MFLPCARAILQDGRSLEFVVVDDPPSGGMKKTFFTPDRSLVVQFYHDQEAARDRQRQARLEAVLGRFNPTLEGPTADYWSRLFCWPLALVIQPGVGVVAPAYPEQYFFATGAFAGKEKDSRWFTSARLRRMLPAAERGDWRGYWQVAILLARAVRRLHQAGLAHADLSSRNVLIDPARGAVTLVDLDSLVVPQLYPPDVLGTPGYLAPEVLATSHLPLLDPGRRLPAARTDQHALAILIYEYLLHRHPLRGPRILSPDSAEEDERLAMGREALFIEHPTNQSNRPEDLGVPYTVVGPYVRELFDRALIRGLQTPAQRPAAIEWERALIRTWDLLHPCGNPRCEHGWFVLAPKAAAVCPFCGWRAERPVPVLTLRTERQPGQWVVDGRLIVYDRLTLFRWHAYAGVFPGEDADATPLAYFAASEGRWFLVNQALLSLTAPSGQRVPPGHSLPLVAGERFRLDSGGRLVEVAFCGG